MLRLRDAILNRGLGAESLVKLDEAPCTLEPLFFFERFQDLHDHVGRPGAGPCLAGQAGRGDDVEARLEQVAVLRVVLLDARRDLRAFEGAAVVVLIPGDGREHALGAEVGRVDLDEADELLLCGTALLLVKKDAREEEARLDVALVPFDQSLEFFPGALEFAEVGSDPCEIEAGDARGRVELEGLLQRLPCLFELSKGPMGRAKCPPGERVILAELGRHLRRRERRRRVVCHELRAREGNPALGVIALQLDEGLRRTHCRTSLSLGDQAARRLELPLVARVDCRRFPLGRLFQGRWRRWWGLALLPTRR